MCYLINVSKRQAVICLVHFYKEVNVGRVIFDYSSSFYAGLMKTHLQAEYLSGVNCGNKSRPDWAKLSSARMIWVLLLSSAETSLAAFNCCLFVKKNSFRSQRWSECQILAPSVDIHCHQMLSAVTSCWQMIWNNLTFV